MKPRTLSQLYSALHQVDAQLLAARAGRVHGKWWDRCVAERQRLRSEITGVTRRWPGPPLSERRN